MKQFARLLSVVFFLLILGMPMHGSADYWHGKERSLRYKPDGEYFINEHGNARFSRALYGTNTGFRLETSDYPEFGMYMPNFGGSMYLALKRGEQFLWVKDAQVSSRFVSGYRQWMIEEPALLGDGRLNIEVVALSDADGYVLRVEGQNCPSDLSLLWIYGAANDRRFSRSGDIGADPINSFYIEPAKCRNNQFRLQAHGFELRYGKEKQVNGLFPKGSLMRLVDANRLENLSELYGSKADEFPLLLVEQKMVGKADYIMMYNPSSRKKALSLRDLPKAYKEGDQRRLEIAGRIEVQTPDPYLNTLGSVIAGAEDAIWEDPGYLHGAIGWRAPLTGWRGSYVADLLGLHDRARVHFDAYAASQLTDVPVVLPHLQDDQLNLARSKKQWGTPMYSNGYITRYPGTQTTMHHYDMNLVYMDELLWHIKWTGDMAYVKEIFPVIERHLAWEKQLFDPDDDALYDGYACIWASDGLQYNGGVGTHSTAYNYRANRLAAELAERIGMDPTPYQIEADRILKALNETLWLPRLGWWAEFKDNMGYKMQHEHAAVWTIYHALDSEIHDPFQGWQASRYVDTHIPHIPVRAEGLKDTSLYVVATTDWQPYMWSINNVAFAEVTHTALSYWQAGRPEKAMSLYKGALMDAMYLGSGPGNITQVSFYDAARGETYRDFADPVATATRGLVHGLFGLYPDMVQGVLRVRPGFPQDWDHAHLKTLNLTYDFSVKGARESYRIDAQLNGLKRMQLEIPVRQTSVKQVRVNGKNVETRFVAESVGRPLLLIEAEVSGAMDVEIEWSGERLSTKMPSYVAVSGATFALPLDASAEEVYDPQQVFAQPTLKNRQWVGRIVGAKGHRSVFVKHSLDAMSWWQPVDIHVKDLISFQTHSEADVLKVDLTNNSANPVSAQIALNFGSEKRLVQFEPFETKTLEWTGSKVRFGSNAIRVEVGEQCLEHTAINWTLANPAQTVYEPVDLKPFFNDRVRDIFAYGKYVSPRWPYTTLQVPTQGMGQWCHPNDLSKIDDRGLRAKAVNDVFVLPQGIPFATPSDTAASNVVFTTLWDNYPNQVQFPLQGNANRAYLLVAASTYHMQAHVLNGRIRVRYTDGSESVLPLVLPDNLLPLDQDIFLDGAAFRSNQPRPYRVRLKTGDVHRHHAGVLGLKMSNDPIVVDGGMATVLDLVLDPNKALKSLSVETRANEVVIGLMGVTLERPH